MYINLSLFFRAEYLTFFKTRFRFRRWAYVIFFTLLYWICDVRHHTRWAAFTRPAGSNTLLTYLLPDLWYFVLGALGITWFRTHLAWGFPGVIRSIIFTGLIIAVASLLTRWKLRLQL